MFGVLFLVFGFGVKILTFCAIFFFQFGVILLITLPKIPECAGDIWSSSVNGKLARLLATGVSLIHLRDGFFFLFQV